MTTRTGEEHLTVAARLPDMPFDAARLDRLLEEAGLDAVLVTSKHNTSSTCSVVTATSSMPTWMRTA